jgi:hypothetical protein
MGAAEDIECLLEIAIVRECPPITGNEGLVTGVCDRGLFKHGDCLGPLPGCPQRPSVLQRRLDVIGFGAIPISVKFHGAHGFGGGAYLRLLTQ